MEMGLAPSWSLRSVRMYLDSSWFQIERGSVRVEVSFWLLVVGGGAVAEMLRYWIGALMGLST